MHRPFAQDPDEPMRSCPSCGTRYDAPAQYCQRDGAALRIEQDASDPYIGTKILGQFRLEKVLGSGGMGVVYAGWDEKLGRRVAVKILHKDLVTNRDIVLRFHREAQIASQLDHPNIVRLILFGDLPDGNLFLVLEFLEGPTLLQAVEKAGRFEPDRAVRVMSAVSDAMGYAHRRDIVHRDLKPENIILVNRDGDPDHPKVLDFGIAKMLIGSDTVVTQAGLIFGTARYISPEGAQGDPVDKRSDVYSLGVMTYQLLAGVTPFDSQEPVQLLLKHIHEAPLPLRRQPGAERVPPAIEAVVMRALAKIPAARYSDGAAYARALREALAAAEAGEVPRPAPTVAVPQYNGAGAGTNAGASGAPAPGSSAASTSRDAPTSVARRVSGVEFVPEASSAPAAPPADGAVVAAAAAAAARPSASNGSTTLKGVTAAGVTTADDSGVVRRATVASEPPAARANDVATRPDLPQHPHRTLVGGGMGVVADATRGANGRAGAGASASAAPQLATAPTVPVASVPDARALLDAAPPVAASYLGARAFAAPASEDDAAVAQGGARPARSSAPDDDGAYVPAAALERVSPVQPIATDDDAVEIPGLPSPRARRAALRTARTVVLSAVVTVLLAAGAAWAFGMYPSQRREAEIRALLHRADDAMRAGRLAHDNEGNDVEDLTDAILALSPGHPQARQLRLIAARSLRNEGVNLRNAGNAAAALPPLRASLRLVADSEVRELIQQIEREAHAPQHAPAPAQQPQPQQVQPNGPAQGPSRTPPTRGVAPRPRAGAPAGDGPQQQANAAQPAQNPAPRGPVFIPGPNPRAPVVEPQNPAPPPVENPQQPAEHPSHDGPPVIIHQQPSPHPQQPGEGVIVGGPSQPEQPHEPPGQEF